ncbi:TPA: hypothetical protein DCE37_13425 [Candidatus Latescibacteria bacterium]|nr:hypothetical protein [Candidatus Latescibacterota bacterium]
MCTNITVLPIPKKLAMPRTDLIRWAARLKQALIRKLYAADASRLRDDRLVDEVGIALMARYESIRRVTERRCPKCG